MNITLRSGFYIWILASAFPASAEVVLPAYFSDDMVVQRNDTLPITGTARPGKDVTVRAGWLDRDYTTKAGPDGANTLGALQNPQIIQKLYQID